MNADDLLKLAERVETLPADAQDPELKDLGKEVIAAAGFEDWEWPHCNPLASLDAAMSLVPAFVTYIRMESGGVGVDGEWHSVLLEWLVDCHARSATALIEGKDAMPRAITAAALRARAAQVQP